MVFKQLKPSTENITPDIKQEIKQEQRNTKKYMVVKELPTEVVRTMIGDDGETYNLLTIEEYLTYKINNE